MTVGSATGWTQMRLGDTLDRQLLHRPSHAVDASGAHVVWDDRLGGLKTTPFPLPSSHAVFAVASAPPANSFRADLPCIPRCLL